MLSEMAVGPEETEEQVNTEDAEAPIEEEEPEESEKIMMEENEDGNSEDQQ